MTLQWISFDLRTGNYNMTLPNLLVDYPIQHTIGQYDTATAHLVIEGSGVGSTAMAPGVDPSVDWWWYTLPGAALLACYDDEDSTQAIQWAGYVNSRIRTAETNIIDLSLVTTEGYLDRRFIDDDITWNATGQNLVAKRLINNYIKDGATAGLPITVVYTVALDDGAVIDQTYRDADLNTVYGAITQLAALDTGPEWTVRWVWRSDHTGLDCHFIVGDRIGTAAPDPTVGGPAAVFNMPGSLISASYTHDYSSDKAANAVRAYPTTMGIGPSDWKTWGPGTRPTFQYQQQAPDSATTVGKLNRVALRAVNQMHGGAKSFTFVADRRSAPVFARDWNLGDDIGFSIGSTATGQPYVAVFPFVGGIVGTQRVFGVQIAEDTITPLTASDTTS